MTSCKLKIKNTYTQRRGYGAQRRGYGTQRRERFGKP